MDPRRGTFPFEAKKQIPTIQAKTVKQQSNKQFISKTIFNKCGASLEGIVVDHSKKRDPTILTTRQHLAFHFGGRPNEVIDEEQWELSRRQ